MPLFMFCLDETSSAAQYDRVLTVLETRFPKLEFERVWDFSPATRNAIFPVMSEPDPSGANRNVASNVPPSQIAAVKEAFAEIVAELKDWKPN